MSEQEGQLPKKRAALWFGLLGGAVAWVLHLLSVYAISEWGCAGPFHGVHWLGIAATVWLLFSATALLLPVAACAVWTGHRSEQELRARGQDADAMLEDRPSGLYTARTGQIASGLFCLIIIAQTIPPFFFLQC